MVSKLTLMSTNLRQFLLCSSDEEGEDSSALLYLPIAPDIEEPEDGFIPEPDSGGSPKRDQENAGPSPAKKKRTKTQKFNWKTHHKMRCTPYFTKPVPRSEGLQRSRRAGLPTRRRASRKENEKSRM